MWPTSEVGNTIISNYMQMNDEAKWYLPVNSMKLDTCQVGSGVQTSKVAEGRWHTNIIIRSYVIKYVI